MAAKKPRIVIIGAGMAGVAAANRLHTSSGGAFDLALVEGGHRIGGRISTSEFSGDRVELGATWIHGIGGSPVHEIASQIGALSSDRPWECMDGGSDDPTRLTTVGEGGFVPDRSVVEPVTELFKSLMCFAQRKPGENFSGNNLMYNAIAEEAFESCPKKGLSIGAFLTKGLSLYLKGNSEKGNETLGFGENIWTMKSLEENVFKVFENTQRTYTSAGDLLTLDYVAESEYQMCSGEEITIAKGYLSVVEHLASVLPSALVHLGKKVSQIEWRLGRAVNGGFENGFCGSNKPVKVHFNDGSIMEADHVIVTVSLGVLKAGLAQESQGLLFNPPLPSFKAEAIRRLGFGVVNKLFVKVSPKGTKTFPFLQMVFREEDSALRRDKIPWWMRKTSSMFPIYEGSEVLLSWFAGDEARALEAIDDKEIARGVSETIEGFLGDPGRGELSNGTIGKCGFVVEEVLKTQWGNDPLFMGSYSYVAVGSSGDDLDRMAEPLPLPLPLPLARDDENNSTITQPLQILFAGEATHRTHYSTTHGAYFSGLREANRLLNHYQCLGV